MLMLPPGSRIFLATQSVDGRKGIDGLSALVRSRFGQDPLSGTLFVFFSKRADRVRVLYWDRDGYVLTMNQLSSYCTSFGSRSVFWWLVLWSARSSGAIHEPIPSAACFLGRLLGSS